MKHILFRAPAIRDLIACLTAVGREDDALRLCMNETLHYPAYTDLFFDGGVLLEKRGEYEAAVKWFNMAMRCGRPPAIFSHTCGTESYLAFIPPGTLPRKNWPGSKQAGDCYRASAGRETRTMCIPCIIYILLQMTNLPAHVLYEYFRTVRFFGTA